MLEVISLVLGNVILSVTDILFVKIVTKQKFNKNILFIILLTLVMTMFHTLIYFYINGILKTILTFAFYMITVKILFNMEWKKTIFITIMYAVLIMIPELLTFVICTSIFNMSKEYCYEVFAGGFWANFIISFESILLTYFIRNFLNKLLNIKLDKNVKTIVLSGLTLLIVNILFYKSFSFVKYNVQTFVTLGTIVIFIIILFNLLRERINNDNLKEQYDKLLEVMVIYEKEIEKQRVIRHENKNNLIAIKSKIIDKDNEKEIVNYIDELLNINTKIKKEKYAKFGYLPSNGIKGLFYYKTDEAEKKKIKVNISISKDIKDSVISNLDTKKFRSLGNIIGVFLDNAIEASSNSKEKELGIEIYTNEDNVEFIISNSYSNKVNKNILGIKSYSTKGINRGHGLMLVDKIIKHNKMFENEKIITDELFIQKLIVKKKENI